MCDNTNTTTQSIADYLSQLLKDRKQLAAFPNVFIHVERLLDEAKCTRLNLNGHVTRGISRTAPFCALARLRIRSADEFFIVT
ncbi:hypothetical protein ALC60_03683 [Trachymyrmex zeteki]|uniref:STAR protein homodimerisation region domain-containing protein n=1 Tax=Mycetomoellerius zeteki TaxID=64791 RepID=A0A151XAH8_9HYME|nr:hypothetical protein ALC60_03683 [Trachymyrmex zeteki]